MKNTIFMIPFMLLLTSCLNSEDPSEVFPKEGPAVEVDVEKCDGDEFSGINNITNLSFSTAELNWDSSDGVYIVYQKDGNQLNYLSTVENDDTYKVLSLTPETSYEFLVKKINSQGLASCNAEATEVLTLEKTIFKSCFEILEADNSFPSDYYEIDPDLEGPEPPLDVYCDMDNNGGGWTRLLVHDVAAAGAFADKAEAMEVNLDDPSSPLYSALSKTSHFERDSKFELWLSYPALENPDEGNVWTQTSNPATESIAGYTPISIMYSGSHWGGMEPSSTNSTLLDGSVNHGNWWYAIGSVVTYQGPNTIPGPSQVISLVYLYVR